MGFDPSLDPPTTQSLSVPVQAPSPAVEVLASAPEPATPQPTTPQPTTPQPTPEPSVAPAPPPPNSAFEPPPGVGATEPPASEPPASGPPAAEPPAPIAPPAPEPSSGGPATAPKGRTATLIAASRATRGRRALVGIGIAVVALLLLGGIGYAIYDRFYADPLADAVAGHCLAGLPLVEGAEESEVSGARLVQCSDPGATYLVQGRLDNVTEEQAEDPLICRGFRHATEIYKAVPAGGTGYVLCLSRVGE